MKVRPEMIRSDLAQLLRNDMWRKNTTSKKATPNLPKNKLSTRPNMTVKQDVVNRNVITVTEITKQAKLGGHGTIMTLKELANIKRELGKTDKDICEGLSLSEDTFYRCKKDMSFPPIFANHLRLLVKYERLPAEYRRLQPERSE